MGATSSHPRLHPWHGSTYGVRICAANGTESRAQAAPKDLEKISQAPEEKAVLVPRVPEMKRFTESIVFFPRTNMCARRSPGLLARRELRAVSPFAASTHPSINPAPIQAAGMGRDACCLPSTDEIPRCTGDACPRFPTASAEIANHHSQSPPELSRRGQ